MKLITDSTADLTPQFVARHGIEIVPLKIQLGQETWRDYFDIDPDDYYRRLRASGLFPTTTQPSGGDFIQAYQRLSRQDDCLISVHISSKLSGTYQAARLASQSVNGARVHVIDSQQTSVGLGLIVCAAQRAISSGKSEEEVLAHINTIAAKIKTYFTVDSLTYLQRGGRLGKAQALLGSILDIKPLLWLKNGEVCPWEKVRGRKKVISRLFNLLRDEAARAAKLKVGLIYTDNEDLLKSLSVQLDNITNLEIEYIGKAGGVITSHVGPGAIGVTYYQDN